MKTAAFYRFNINTAIKIILLLGFASFFMVTIFTGSVSLYVHPRIVPYMIFASVVMVIIALLLLGSVFKQVNRKVNSWSLLIYIIPLVMAFGLPANSFDSSTGTIGNVQIAGNESESNSQTDNSSTSVVQGLQRHDNQLILQNGVLIVTDGNYYESINEVYANMDQYNGVKIEVVGQVFNKSEKFAYNEFVPIRLLMTCCAADMVSVGFLCRYEEASDLQADSWIKVTGTIGKTEFEGETVPYIDVESVEETGVPDDEYIYPY